MAHKLQVISFVRGYHEYMDIWLLSIDDEHCLKREPSNKEDANAVAVVRDSSLKRQKYVETGQNSKQLCEISSEVRSSHPNEMSEDFQVVGHVPKLMAIWLTKFLKRASNIGKAVIKGKRVNRGGGYGLEIPCEYQFMGDAFSISWLKDKLQKEGFDAN